MGHEFEPRRNYKKTLLSSVGRAQSVKFGVGGSEPSRAATVGMQGKAFPRNKAKPL